jgi:hypothetical protein
LIAYPPGNGVTELVIPEGVNVIVADAFYGFRHLTSVTLPESLTEIQATAFARCSALTSIDLKNVQIIRHSAFAASGLISVVIPDGVTTIDGTFSSCVHLASVTIPGSVTSITNSAFGACNSLAEITVYWATPLSIVSDVFGGATNISNATLHVPKGKKGEYEAALVWQDFGTITDSDFDAVENEPSVPVGNSGSITLKLTVSPGATIVGSFKVTLADGFTIDADNCVMAEAIADYYDLEIENDPADSQTWVFTITEKPGGASAAAARSMLAMLRSDGLMDIVTVAFKVDPSVDDGDYDVTFTELDFTVTDAGGGTTQIQEAELIVPVIVRTEAVTSITLNHTTLSGEPGGSAQLTANVLPEGATDKSIAWSSSNTAVATVSNAGLVTYVAPGTATITAKNEASGVTATCAVTVTAPPTPDPEPEPTPDPDLTAIYAALTTIQFSTINIPQSAGNTETEVAAWLTSYLNTQFEQLQYYVTVSSVAFSAFEAATEGTAANMEGTNGAVTFSATFSKGSQSVLASYIYGTIVATMFTSGNEAAVGPTLKAVSDNGQLLISGLTPGDELKVYNATGQLVYSAKADAAEVRLDAARGVYIIASGKSTVKAAVR